MRQSSRAVLRQRSNGVRSCLRGRSIWVAALHDRLEPAEPHPDQFPTTGPSIRPFVDHREPLCLVRVQRQNDPSIMDEARERLRRVFPHAATEIGSRMGGAALSESLGRQTFVTVLAAFALGYAAALLIHRAR